MKNASYYSLTNSGSKQCILTLDTGPGADLIFVENLLTIFRCIGLVETSYRIRYCCLLYLKLSFYVVCHVVVPQMLITPFMYSNTDDVICAVFT